MPTTPVAKHAVEVTIRILDTDGVRLARVERELLRRLKSWGVTARVICLGCGLEIARQGFTEGTPALLMNQYTVSSGVEITSEILEEFCKKLVHWLTLHDSSDNEPASSQIP